MCGGHRRRSGRNWTGASRIILLLFWGVVLPTIATAADGASDTDADILILGTVTPIPAPEFVHGSANSVAIIEIDDQLPPGATLADALDGVAGIHIRRFGGPGDPAWVGIRGASARQVEVYIDGVPLNAGGLSAVDLADLPVGGFDRVEVFRGHAPASFGASPIGGVVNLRTLPGAVVPTRLEAGGGSWWTRRAFVEAGLGRSFAGGRGDLRLSLDYDGTQGDFPYLDGNGTPYNRYDDRTRRRTNNAQDRLGMRVRGRWAGGPTVVTLAETLTWKDGGEPGPGHGITQAARMGGVDQLLSLDLEVRPVRRVTLEGRVAWRGRWDQQEDPLGELGNSSESTRDQSHEPQLRLAGRIDLGRGATLIPSASVLLSTYTPKDLLAHPTTDGTRSRVASRLGVAMDLEAWDTKLILSPAVDLLVLDNRFLGKVPWTGLPIASAATQVDASFLPRIAGAFRPARWITIRGALALGERPPDFAELFGDRGSVAGNTSLVPEQGVEADGSVRVRGELRGRVAGTLEVGGFVNDTRNLIIYLGNAQQVSVPVNLGRSRIAGIEANGELRLFGHMEIDAALTWSDSRILAGLAGHVGRHVPNVPALALDLGVALVFPPQLRAGWRLRHLSGTFDSPSNAFLQPDRTTHELFLRVAPHPRAPWFAVSVDNLFDRRLAPRYRNADAPREADREVVPIADFRGQPLPGRSLMITLGGTLDPKERP